MSVKHLAIAGLLLLAAAVNWAAPPLLAHLGSLGAVEAPIALSLWCVCLFLGFGWGASYLTEGTRLPNFSLQLLTGVLLHDALSPLSHQLPSAVVLCTALAAIILKVGGDEIDRKQFGSVAYPTFMLAVLGYLLTFVIMYLILGIIGVETRVAALLAAIIGSTDPAALIPTLKRLRFRSQSRQLADMAVAESAINDAVGAIITTAVVAMIVSGTELDSVAALFTHLAAPETLIQLGEQFLFGIVAGLVGWACMYSYERLKSPLQQETAYDFGLTLVIPLFTFMLAQAIHGNGFLAAFVVGLMANYNHAAERFHLTLHAMEVKIESIGKPVIFMMVGPLVSLRDLLDTFWVGLIVSAAFIFIARPLAVHLSLLPTRLPLRDRWFLCVVRETGVIPVVLAVIATAQIPSLTSLLPLTAWVAVWTLSLLPAVTPWWAGKLGLTEQDSAISH